MSSLDPNADMIVDDLPTGSWYLFAANVFISYFFQFIGFLFTYLLHTTHAAKFGSRVGLGITLIQFGFQSRRRPEDGLVEVQPGPGWNATMASNADGEFHAMATTTLANGTVVEVPLESLDLTSRDWVSFLLMTLGTQSLNSPKRITKRFIYTRMVPTIILLRWLLQGEALGKIYSCLRTSAHSSTSGEYFGFRASLVWVADICTGGCSS